MATSRVASESWTTTRGAPDSADRRKNNCNNAIKINVNVVNGTTHSLSSCMIII